jgi:hypothetical protein
MTANNYRKPKQKIPKWKNALFGLKIQYTGSFFVRLRKVSSSLYINQRRHPSWLDSAIPDSAVPS